MQPFFDVFFIVLTVGVLIFFNALYVAAEFATVASRRTRIQQMAADGNRRARALMPILTDPHKVDNYVAGCQVGITVSSIAVGIYGQNALATRLAGPLTTMLSNQTLFDINPTVVAESVAVILVLTILTGLQVIIGELVPKSIAIQFPERVALAVVYPMIVSLKVFDLLIRLFNGSGRIILRVLRLNTDITHHQVYSPEEIEILVTGSHQVGLLDEEERQMLRNTFRLRDLTARHVMVHRTRFVSAPLDSNVETLMRLSLAEGYTRIPLYQDKIDNVQGFVHIKDIFRLHVEGVVDVGEIVRDVLYVPETMPILDVWEALNKKGQYMAIVFDEYGSTAGLITMEDLVEEIFGELQDEFDDESALVALDKDGRLYLRGDLLVSDVNEYLDLDLPLETADTLSGLVLSELGRQPIEGDQVEFNGSALRVEAVADLGVAEVSIELKSTELLKLSEWELTRRE